MRPRIALIAALVSALPAPAKSQPKPAAPKAPAGPVLRIANSDGDGIEFTRTEKRFRHTFRIVATNAFPTTDLVATVAPFQDAAGNQFDVTIVQSPSPTVTLREAATLELAAELPRPGVYTTELELTYAKTRTATRLTVVRVESDAIQAPAAGVEPVGSVAVRDERSLFGDPVWIGLRLRETAGTERKLSIPTLTRLDRKGDDGELVQSDGRLHVLGPLGRVGNEFSLRPRGEAALALQLYGLREAGRYEGSVRMTSEGTEPLDVGFAVTLRDSGWLAAFYIALGVVASHLLRLYFRRWRRLLVWRRDLARLRDRLRALGQIGSLDDRDREVLGALRAHLDALGEDVGYEATGELGEAIKSLSGRIELADEWLRARRRVALLDAGERRSELQGKLDDVADTLRARGATLEEIADAAKLLADLNVRSEERTSLDAALAKFEQTIEAAEQDASQELRAALDDRVRPILRGARAGHHAEEFDQVREQLDQARREYAVVMAQTLAATLRGKRPREIPEGPWKSLGAEITGLLDEVAGAKGEAAIERYERAHAIYVRSVSEHLANASRKKAREIADSARAEPEKKALRKKLGEITAALEERGDVRAMARAQTDLRTLERKLEAGAVDEEDLSFAPGAPAPEGAAWIPGSVPSAAPRSIPEAPVATAAGIQKKLRSYDGMVTVAILLIAVVSGVQVLWAGDATWGDFNSRLLAFLWGLGLHQVGNVPFESLLGLRQRFAKDD